ncbi:MAG: hypothetical protein ACP5KN_03210 [Armatimonadota bacterium]
MIPDAPHHKREHLDRMVARQKRRHLVAQLMTARRWARQLEQVLLKGTSPTGYSSPLTPLPRDQAERVLRPVRTLIEHLRDFVAEHAPEELAEAERRRSRAETRLWARNLLEQLRDTLDELTMELSGEDRAEQVQQDAKALRRRVRRLIDEAHSSLNVSDEG